MSGRLHRCEFQRVFCQTCGVVNQLTRRRVQCGEVECPICGGQSFRSYVGSGRSLRPIPYTEATGRRLETDSSAQRTVGYLFAT